MLNQCGNVKEQRQTHVKEQRQTHVSESTDRLGKHTQELIDVIDQLTERLSAVLRQEPTCGDSSKQPNEAYVPLAEVIIGCDSRILVAIGRINDIKNRLEL